MTVEMVGEEVILSREFNAPRELVYKAWTESERLAEWWGPKGFTMYTKKLDLRPGGEFLYSMQMGNGPKMWGKFVYKEVAPPEKIVFVNSFTDEEGTIIRSPMSKTWPLEVHNTLTLTEQNGKTHLTLRGGPLNATEEETKTFMDNLSSLKQGFSGTFDQLDQYLASQK